MSANKYRQGYQVLRYTALAAAAFLLLAFPFLPFSGTYLLYMAQSIGIGIIMTLGLNVCWGYAGVANFGVAAPYAIGAYSFALLQRNAGIHFLLALPITLIVCGVIGYLVYIPLSRVRHFMQAVGNLAFAISVWHLAESLTDVTGGEDGLTLPKMVLFGQVLGDAFSYYLIMALAVAGFIFLHYLVSSRIGYVMRATRDDELAAAVLGINTHKYRTLAFVICYVYAGLAGILLAMRALFITPSTFGLLANMTPFLMIMIGGFGSNLGSVIGGTFILLLTEYLSGFAEYQMLIEGIILVLIVMFLPRGIAPWLVAAARKLVPRPDRGLVTSQARSDASAPGS